MLRDVSVYFNFESFVDPAVNGAQVNKSVIRSGAPLDKMVNLARTMIEAHLCYDIGVKQRLGEMVKLSKLIVIPNQLCLMMRKWAVLTEFVREGGSLIVTNRSSLCDKNGNKGDDFALSGLTGVHYNR
jgi:hypothetical protein